MSVLAQDLHEKLRGKFNSLTMGRDDGAKTLVPDEAVFFEFEFTDNGEDFGSVVVSILDEGSLKIYFKNDIIDGAGSGSKRKWYDFLKDLRYFSSRNMINYEAKNITKTRLDKSDFDFLVGKSNSKDKVAMESKLYGSKQKSYQDLNGARLLVQHHNTVDEDRQGSRSRDIKAIYIENSMGERFRFENNYLPGARAMARHISNGGYQNDEHGEHISEIMAEMSELKGFVRSVKKDDYVSEDAQDVIEKATSRYYGLKSTLESVTKQRGYIDYFENFEPHEIEVDEDDVNDLRTRLTREVFDTRLENSLGAVSRAVKLSEKKTGDHFKDVNSWLAAAKAMKAEVKDGDMNTPDAEHKVAVKDGKEIGEWYFEKEDQEGHGEMGIGMSDRGADSADSIDRPDFELPATLEMMPGTPAYQGMQFMDNLGRLTAVLRDVADRAQDDSVANWAGNMANEISSEDTTFGKRTKDDPDYKANKIKAISLAKMALAQSKSIAAQPEPKQIEGPKEAVDPMEAYENAIDGVVEGGFDKDGSYNTSDDEANEFDEYENDEEDDSDMSTNVIVMIRGDETQSIKPSTKNVNDAKRDGWKIKYALNSDGAIERYNKPIDQIIRDGDEVVAETSGAFNKMSDVKLKAWIKKNDTDEPDISPVFGQQIKAAYRELKARGLKLNEHSEMDSFTNNLNLTPEEDAKIAAGPDVYEADEALMDKLYRHFSDEMPYGTQKGRDGDPHEYIFDKLDAMGLIKESEEEDTVKEGTWHIADDMSGLQELIASGPIPAKDAIDIVGNYIGDDELYDDLGELADNDPDADARGIISDFLEQGDTDVHEEDAVEEDDMAWLKKAAGINSGAKSNHGIHEGEAGYQITPRSLVARDIRKLQDIAKN